MTGLHRKLLSALVVILYTSSSSENTSRSYAYVFSSDLLRYGASQNISFEHVDLMWMKLRESDHAILITESVVQLSGRVRARPQTQAMLTVARPTKDMTHAAIRS
jgi:hypothetical protein